MDELLQRARSFRENGYAERSELFRRLESGQHPHTLFICCSDSRIDPTLITGAEPGELFVVRNVANTVPPYATTGDRAGDRAAIEYAVLVLGVTRIVVMGHAGCGGCAAKAAPESVPGDLPNLQAWCAQQGAIAGATPEEIEQANIVCQLEQLRDYPFVAERLTSGELTLGGWYYKIATGEIVECG